jgi:hypothetical protein
MKCQVIQQLLPLYVEGDLPPRKRERVDHHLESCLGCRGLCDEYRRSQQWLHASVGPPLSGEKLESMRRAVWRRLDHEPRPTPLWLALERGWMALRRWAGQPGIAVAAVGLVVLGSVTMTRMSGLGGTRLGVPPEVQVPHEELSDDSAGEVADDPGILAVATPDEMEAAETGEAEPTDESAANNMRIEIQTKDPNVRIIWLTPPTTEAAPVEN